MPGDWINVLSPVAAGIIDRLTKGESVKASERGFILLYSIAQDVKELRADISGLNDAVHGLTGLINELRVETALLRGRSER